MGAYQVGYSISHNDHTQADAHHHHEHEKRLFSIRNLFNSFHFEGEDAILNIDPK